MQKSKKHNKIKFIKAFSVTEFLVVLVIVGIFAVVSAPIFTQKNKKPSYTPPRGQFECYIKDGNVYQRTLIEQSVKGPFLKGPVGSESGKCSFTPPVTRAAYFMITIVGGGGGSATSSGNCGHKGVISTVFLPEIKSDSVIITPGNGGLKGFAVGSDGGATIFSTGIDGILTVEGGKGASVSNPLSESESSGFDEYRAAGGYDFLVEKSGNGGEVNSDGHPGAALIVW